MAINWGIWNEVGMAAEAVAARTGDLPPGRPRSRSRFRCSTDQVSTTGQPVFHASYSQDDWVIDEHRTKAGDALMPGSGYLTLAAHALRAHREDGPFEIRDLDVLRPLKVADGAVRDVRVRLARTPRGYGLDVLADATLNGRSGFALTAQGRLNLMPMERPDPLDLRAIRARCGVPCDCRSRGKLPAAQEVMLAFGPRWKVLDSARHRRGEGIADLSLPEVARVTTACCTRPDGHRHRLGDASSSRAGSPRISGHRCAMAACRVHAPLPDRVVSWVRNAGENRAAAETASFDITLCDPDGRVWWRSPASPSASSAVSTC